MGHCSSVPLVNVSVNSLDRILSSQIILNEMTPKMKEIGKSKVEQFNEKH
jgi:hypothetical protein